MVNQKPSNNQSEPKIIKTQNIKNLRSEINTAKSFNCKYLNVYLNQILNKQLQSSKGNENK